MGGSAAGNSYQEKLNAGWDKKQALTYATIVGVSEAGLQYAMGGIGSLGGKVTGKSAQAIARGIDNAILRFVATYGMKMTSEGMEEALQEVLTPFFENIALGYQKNDLSDIEWEQVVYSGMLGALSAGFLEGVSTSTEVFGENKDANKMGKHLKNSDYTSRVLEIASSSPKNSATYDLYSQYAKKGINAENISELQLGRLFVNAEADVTEALSKKKIKPEQGQAALATLVELNAKKSKSALPVGVKSTDTVTDNRETSEPDSLEQAARDVVESRNKKNGKVNAEMLDRLTADNQPIYVDEVKEVTGFGDRGARVITGLANRDGVTFSQAKSAVETAYKAGFTGVKEAQVNFDNKLQQEAFRAGKYDRAMDDAAKQAEAKNARVFAGAFTENELTKDYTEGETGHILERDLIQQGVPYADRINIIQAATEIERSLKGTKHSISSVISGVRKITNNLAKSISKKVGNVQNLWGLLNTNLKALQNDTISQNRELISAYADTYLDTMKNNEYGGYNAIFAGEQNVSDALTEYLVTGIMPKEVQNQEGFFSVAEDIMDIVRTAEGMLRNAREQLYGNKTSSAEKDILSTGSSHDIIDTSTGTKVSYSLDSTGSDAQPGVMWTIEDGVLTNKDVTLFYQEISKLNYRNSRNYHVSADGEYIFDIENKLIYTDGNYSYPMISKVISFDSVYEDEILFAKEVFFDAEETQSGLEYAFEIVECFKGPGFVTATNIEDSGAYARQVRGRKRTDSRETHKTGEAGVAGEQEGISYSYDNATDEGEVNKNEQSEDLLSDDGSKWKYSKGSGGQTRKVDGRSRRHKEGKKTKRKRRERCQALKDAGHTRKRVVLGHRCEVIPEKHYDTEMMKLVNKNKKNGIDETILVVGGIEIPQLDSNDKVKTARGMFIRTEDGRKIVVIQCDNEYWSPNQINDHELVHNDYESERTQLVKNIILKTIPVKKRNELLGIIQDDYSGILEDLEGDALQELVANILSEMHYLSNDFLELSKAYWDKDDALIKRWEYEVSKKSFARAVEKGYASEMRRINRRLAYDEHVQLREYIMSVNNNSTELKERDSKEIGNNIYIWLNKSKTDYKIISVVPIEGNQQRIDFMRSETNGIDRNGKELSDLYKSINGGYGNSSWSGGANQNGETNASHDSVSSGKSSGKQQTTGNGPGNFEESNRDKSDDKVSSLPNNNDTVIKYVLKENGMWDMEHIFENDDPEAEAAMMRDWKALLEKYGAIPSGEDPHRKVQVPRKTADNKKVSQTVRTILEAKATPDEAVPTIEKMVEEKRDRIVEFREGGYIWS